MNSTKTVLALLAALVLSSQTLSAAEVSAPAEVRQRVMGAKAYSGSDALEVITAECEDLGGKVQEDSFRVVVEISIVVIGAAICNY